MKRMFVKEGNELREVQPEFVRVQPEFVHVAFPEPRQHQQERELRQPVEKPPRPALDRRRKVC